MKQSVQAREELTIPTYTVGKTKQQPRAKIPRSLLTTIVCAGLICAVLYVPPILTTKDESISYSSTNLTHKADPTAMQVAQDYLRNHPDDDFDGDGLINELENDWNTGVYVPDHDGDGTSDYAEIYLTETNPKMVDDAISRYVINSDTKNGLSVNTPFTVNGVVLWADDYNSKARGSVISLPDGSYNFYRFTGWVQFENATYAYKVVNNTQVALKKNANGYFYIDNSGLTNVRIYTEQPDSCVALYVFGNRILLPDNIATRLLNAILPHKGTGLLVSKLALKNDFDGTWDDSANIKQNIKTTYYAESYPDNRFAMDGSNSITTLSQIMTAIDNGNNVIVSLMSHTSGENIVEIYGYTKQGNLLVCDPSTNTDDGNYGIINIDIIGERILDATGTIATYEHFQFNGCGYNSASRHRFTIVDIVPAGGAINRTIAGTAD